MRADLKAVATRQPGHPNPEQFRPVQATPKESLGLATVGPRGEGSQPNHTGFVARPTEGPKTKAKPHNAAGAPFLERAVAQALRSENIDTSTHDSITCHRTQNPHWIKKLGVLPFALTAQSSHRTPDVVLFELRQAIPASPTFLCETV